MKDFKYIPFDECEQGWLYYVDCRNSYMGIFVKQRNGFVIVRFKFGHEFLFTELHWDRDDHYGTARPLEKLMKFPEEIPENFSEHNDLNDKMFQFIKSKLNKETHDRFEQLMFGKNEK
jgi:hypothetical protein